MAGGAGWRPGSKEAATKAVCLADLATLATLAELAPSLLQKALPAERRGVAGVSRLLALLACVGRVVAMAGDRGALLVSQSLRVAAAPALAQLAAAETVDAEGEGDEAWLAAADRALAAAAAAADDELPRPEELLPSAASAAADGGGRGVLLSDDDLLTLRLGQLTAWAGDGYGRAMAAARPLRQVVAAAAAAAGTPTATQAEKRERP